MAAILKKDYVRNALNSKKDQWKPSFTKFDCFLVILSIGTYFADISTDVIVLVQYFSKCYITWGILTLMLVTVPSIIVQVFSIRWHILDGNANKICCMIHMIQLGIFDRYVKLLKVGFKARRSKALTDFQQFYQQQSDICMLRLFESFMESAPQLVLQLYIMLSTEKWNVWTGISAGASLISLSWGISAYSKAMRNFRADKQRLSICGMVLQIVWRSGTVSSRILSMVLFATVFGPWLILIGVAHWLAMTIWVVFQDTDFCTTWWEERLYNCIVGAIYCFCFFNLKEGHSRCRATIFYTITFLQNAIFLFSYYTARSEQDQKDLMAGIVMTAFAIGVLSMLLYYRFLHPSGPIHLCKVEVIEDTMSVKEVSNGNEQFEQNGIDTRKHPMTEISTNTVNDLSLCQNSLLHVNEHSKNNIHRSERNGNINLLLSPYSCQGTNHHSHSQNCSLINIQPNESLCNDITIMPSVSLKNRVASRYKMVNYNFRPRVSFRQLHDLQIHCSCLVLAGKYLTDNENKDTDKYSIERVICKSLPNLALSQNETSIEVVPNLNRTWSLNNLYESKNESSTLLEDYNNSYSSLNEEFYLNERNNSYVCDCSFILPVGVTCRCKRKRSKKYSARDPRSENSLLLEYNANASILSSDTENRLQNLDKAQNRETTADTDCIIDCASARKDAADKCFYNNAFSIKDEEKCRKGNHHIQNCHSSEIYQIQDPNMSFLTSKVCIVWNTSR